MASVTYIDVKATWMRYRYCDGFHPSDTEVLRGRVTPKKLHVKFPSGHSFWVKRLSRDGRQLTSSMKIRGDNFYVKLEWERIADE